MPVKGKLPFAGPLIGQGPGRRGNNRFVPLRKLWIRSFSEFDAFRLDEDGLLVGISDFPHYDDRDLLGYEAQKQPSLTIRPFLQQERKVTMCCSPGPGERENPPWSKPWFPALEKKVCALSKWSEPNWTTCPVFYPSSAKKSTIVLCFFG